MSLPPRRIVIFCALLAAVFLGGVAFHKYKFFPYAQLAALAKTIKQTITRQAIDPSKVLASQYTRDIGELDLRRNIDTALLPLRMNGVRLSEHYDFPKSGGALAVVNDMVVIMDWLGNAYLYRNGQVDKLEFPRVPNNINEFITNFNSLTPGFRVQDVDYLPSSKELVVSHEFFDNQFKTTRLAVSTIRIDEQSLKPVGSWKTIFSGDLLNVTTYAGIGGGGRMAVQAEGRLLLTTGDYNQDNVMFPSPKVSQDTNSTFGKVYGINVRTGEHWLVSYGHRNPQGLLVTENGDIFSTEHGPAGGDELNHIRADVNFGWPNVTLGTDYVSYDWPNTGLTGNHQGYAMPAFAWVPSIGVGNLIQVTNFDTRWNGDFLVASLKAMTLFRLRLDGRRVVYSEPVWIGERIRDIAQLKNGTIVLWTDDSKLLFLTTDQQKLLANRREMDVTSPALAVCMTCHHPTNPTHVAPTLSDLLGREIASDNYSLYSPGLKNVAGVWTAQSLKAFISNPTQFAPGSLMPKSEMKDQQIDKIIQLLVTQTHEPEKKVANR